MRLDSFPSENLIASKSYCYTRYLSLYFYATESVDSGNQLGCAHIDYKANNSNRIASRSN